MPRSLLLLGTGGPDGIPVVGCSCSTCQSNDPRDQRNRGSAIARCENTNIIIDSGTDLRRQMLEYGIISVDVALLTRPKSETLHGLDDLRVFTQGKRMKLVMDSETSEDVVNRFDYAFIDIPERHTKPNFEVMIIDTDDFVFETIRVTPIRLMQGDDRVTGFKVGDLAYLPPFSTITDHDALNGVKKLVIAMHNDIEETVNAIRNIGPEKAWITELDHKFTHIEFMDAVKDDITIEIAHDGLEIPFFDE